MGLLVFVHSGCGPKNQFQAARQWEEKGQYHKAWNEYQEFVAHYPEHPLAPEALFRIGWVTQIGLRDCYMANIFYQRVNVEYPQSDPWARAASLQQLNCPDFFPLIPGGRWKEGDSDTKGKIAKTIIECSSLSKSKGSFPSEKAKVVRTFYSGDKKFRSVQFVYRKEKNVLSEYVSEKDPRAKTILKWPLKVGTQWRTKMAGRFFHYEVVAINQNVRVAAGNFSGCVKIGSSVGQSVGLRFEYYAPGVGRVLTTLSTKSGEKRNTELLSYEIPLVTSFNVTGFEDSEPSS